MSSVENPYRRLPFALDPDKYYGGQENVRFALEQISGRSPNSLEFSGLPGMGKSSLLRYLARPDGALLRHREWLQNPFQSEPHRLFPVLVEFRPPTGMHPFVYLYNRLHEEYPAYCERIRPHMESDLPLLTRSVAERPEVAVDHLERDLKKLAEQGIRPVLLLDDFHLAFDPQYMTRAQTTRLRPFQRFVAFILTTERPLHLVNPEAAGSPFWQTLPIMHLGGLSHEEALTLIKRPAGDAGYPFPSQDIEFILEHADGHPFLLMLAGKALWDTRARVGLLDKRDQPLLGELLAVLRGRLLEDFGRSFQAYWECLEMNERDALWALVRGEALTNNGYAALATLELKGLVKYDTKSGHHTPFSPLFGTFVSGMPKRAEARAEPRLTGLEANLYEYLRQNPERVCTYEELWRAVWDQASEEIDPTELRRRIHVTASRLRNALEAEGTGEHVANVRMQGYRLSVRTVLPRRRK